MDGLICMWSHPLEESTPPMLNERECLVPCDKESEHETTRELGKDANQRYNIIILMNILCVPAVTLVQASRQCSSSTSLHFCTSALVSQEPRS